MTLYDVDMYVPTRDDVSLDDSSDDYHDPADHEGHDPLARPAILRVTVRVRAENEWAATDAAERVVARAQATGAGIPADDEDDDLEEDDLDV